MANVNTIRAVYEPSACSDCHISCRGDQRMSRYLQEPVVEFLIPCPREQLLEKSRVRCRYATQLVSGETINSRI